MPNQIASVVRKVFSGSAQILLETAYWTTCRHTKFVLISALCTYIVAAQGRAFPPLLWPGRRRSGGLSAGAWNVICSITPRAWSPSVSPPSRPQATVITEPRVRWPATIYTPIQRVIELSESFMTVPKGRSNFITPWFPMAELSGLLRPNKKCCRFQWLYGNFRGWSVGKIIFFLQEMRV